MGYASLSMTLGLFAGPSVGGVLYEHAGYYALFIVAYSLIGLDVLLRLVMIQKTGRSKGKGVEQPDAIVASEASPLLEEAIQDRNNRPHTEAETHERRDCQNQPEQQDGAKWRLLRPRMLTAFWACFAQNFVVCTFDSVLPLFLARQLDWQTAAIALMFLAISLPSLAAPIVGHLSDRYGARLPAAIGFLLATPALVALRFVYRNDRKQVALLIVLFLLIGFAFGIVMTVMMAEVSHALSEPAEASNPFVHQPLAQAYGLMNMAFAVGTFLGPLWGAYMMTKFGWAQLTFSLGLFSAVSAIPVLIFSGRRARDRDGSR
ncbi:MAG: hypothetical protein Q9218_007789 [Villophora microphyllina]